jgi:hypothetical protein
MGRGSGTDKGRNSDAECGMDASKVTSVRICLAAVGIDILLYIPLLSIIATMANETDDFFRIFKAVGIDLCMLSVSSFEP